MRRPGADPYDKRAALTFAAHDARGAAMQPAELLYQREADASALERPGARVLQSMEPLEDPRQLALRDAAAGVVHRQLYVIATPREGHADLAVECELERVRQQVEDDLLPHVPVDIHRLGQGRAVDD